MEITKPTTTQHQLRENTAKPSNTNLIIKNKIGTITMIIYHPKQKIQVCQQNPKKVTQFRA